jgi:alpha-beta hydrolase superfamily lysophospholipase
MNSKPLARHLLLMLGYGTLGALVAVVALFVVYLESRPELELWHRAELTAEFTIDTKLSSLEAYRALERRLFDQLEQTIYGHTGPAAPFELNRYKRGSPSDPARWPRNWNRTFELERDDPRAVALLLHGLSDSPYSMRATGATLHAAGLHVVGLRIPGHGTVPSALVHTTWQDMAAAVRVAVADLDRRFPGRPLHLVGYSNGAALALQHALAAIEDDSLRMPDRLVLMSPEIAVTGAAALSVWQARLGHWLGLEKLAWNNVQPEYDPFKYGSFAIAAAYLSHGLTSDVENRILRLNRSERLDAMPPILAFSSLVDATVQAPELVARLFNPLPSGGHELVLFDINRQAGMASLLKWRPDEWMAAMDQATDGEYRLTVVTNEHPDRLLVEAREMGTGTVSDVRALGLSWPREVYALSHVALPFPETDSLYGAAPEPPSPGVSLGAITLRGERGVLQIGDSAMLRQRWNPFHPYLQERMLTFLGLSP